MQKYVEKGASKGKIGLRGRMPPGCFLLCMIHKLLDINGYGFNGIGSLEEYYAYDVSEYWEGERIAAVSYKEL